VRLAARERGAGRLVEGELTASSGVSGASALRLEFFAADRYSGSRGDAHPPDSPPWRPAVVDSPRRPRRPCTRERPRRHLPWRSRLGLPAV